MRVVRVVVKQDMRLLQTVSEHQRFVAEQVAGCGIGNQNATVKDDGTRTEFDDHLQIVSGNELGGRNLPEQRLEFTPPARVEVAGWFVEDEHRGVAGQHSSKTDAAFLTVAQMVGGAMAEVRQAHLIQCLLHTRFHVRLREAKLLWTKSHIFNHRGAEQLIVRVLKHEPHLSSNRFQIVPRNRFAVDTNCAIHIMLVRENTVEMKEQSGFPRAIRSEKSDALAWRYAEANAAKSLCAVVITVGKILKFDGGSHLKPRAHMAA